MKIQNIKAAPAPVRIRTAQRRDVPRLVEMVAALAEHHGDAAAVTPRTLERDLFDATACASALLAERAGTTVGYAALTTYPHLHSGRRVMELHHLYVAPGHRSSGVGRQLIAAVVEEARRQECGRLVVSTHPENARAQNIYLSLGFAEKTSGGPRFKLDLPATGALPEGWV